MGCGGSKEAAADAAPAPAAPPPHPASEPPVPSPEELARRAEAAAAAQAAAEAAEAAAAAERAAAAAAASSPSHGGGHEAGGHRVSGHANGRSSAGRVGTAQGGHGAGHGSLGSVFASYCRSSASPGCVVHKQVDQMSFRSWCMAAGLTHGQGGLSSMQVDATFKQSLKFNVAPEHPPPGQGGLVQLALTWDAFLAACDKLAFLKGWSKEQLMEVMANVEAGDRGAGAGSPGMLTANRLFTRRT